MRTALFFLALALTASAKALAAVPVDPAEQSRQLVAIVQSDASPAERVRACQQLALVGTKEAVPVLAALLSDPLLGFPSRDALEGIPGAAADDALRAALPKLDGRRLVGLVNSIGMRRDAAAVDALARLSTDPTSVAAEPALVALGRIGTPAAIRVLQSALARGPAELRDAAAEGCLLCADRASELGRRDAAVALYDTVRQATVATQLRATATHGAILAREGAEASRLVIALLSAGELAMRDVALRAVRELPGAEATSAFAAELPKLSPALQPLFIPALVDRGDPRTLAVIEAASASNTDEVRIAALSALGKIGGKSSLPILLGATVKPSEADAAFSSLARVRNSDADAAILSALAVSDPVIKAKLIAILAERGAVSAVPELMKLSETGDLETRKACFRALGLLTRPDELPALIRLALASPEDDVKSLADRAVVTTAMKVLEVERRDDVLLAAFRQTSDAETKRALLRPLAVIVRSMGQSDEALAAVRSALDDPSESLRAAAQKVLAEWPKPKK